MAVTVLLLFTVTVQVTVLALAQPLQEENVFPLAAPVELLGAVKVTVAPEL